jgi:hypothetical protein
MSWEGDIEGLEWDERRDTQAGVRESLPLLQKLV